MRPCRPTTPLRAQRCAIALLLTFVSHIAHAGNLHMLHAVGDLSLEELRNVVVSSVSRREQPLADAAASIYVISGDEIRRTGATSLPEALRLAPNLEVAALDNRQYAITARGFNSNIANKLLVLIDGRTIYSPLFSGVFWDVQDFAPQDIDRIEVISGPAGATWGTNAVNGVINIVTLSARRTQGTSVTAGAGNLDRRVWARYGFSPAEGLFVRARVSGQRRGPSLLRSGGDAHDAEEGATAGLRADWRGERDLVTLDAAAYTTHTDERPTLGAVKASGGHLLARWTRALEQERQLEWQASYDSNDRRDQYLLQTDGSVVDTELRWRAGFGEHRVIAGAGYRRSDDEAAPGLLFAFLPPQRSLDWYSLWGQDEWGLGEHATLTLGTRFEHNPYTGWETLPSVRLGYRLTPEVLLWGALSRAVRSPARLDREIYTPPQPPYAVAGGSDFRSEVAKVIEGGMRAQLGSDASLSVTAFLQSYDQLRSVRLSGSSYVIANDIEGQVRGIEAWGEWKLRRDWRLMAGMLYLDKDLRLKPGSTDPTGPSNLGNDPSAQWSLRSVHALGSRAELSVSLRRVGRLPAPQVPAYTAADLQMNWQVASGLELSLGVRNAFDKRHLEFDPGAQASEIPRSAFVSVSCRLP